MAAGYAKAGPITSGGGAGGFMLLHAVNQGDLAQCQMLLVECPLNINHRNAIGESCLHVAVTRGLVTMLELLLRYGADPNVTTLARCGSYTPLHIAARTNNPKIASILLLHNADPNIPDAVGKLPLHEAAINGYEALARLLLSHGSIASAEDHLGCTPLHHAKKNRRDAVALCIMAAIQALDPEATASSPSSLPKGIIDASSSGGSPVTLGATSSGGESGAEGSAFYIGGVTVPSPSQYAAAKAETDKRIQWRIVTQPKGKKR